MFDAKFSTPHQISAFSAASLASSGAQAELSATGPVPSIFYSKTNHMHWTDKEPFMTATKLNKDLCFSGDMGKSESYAPERSYSVLERVNDK